MSGTVEWPLAPRYAAPFALALLLIAAVPARAEGPVLNRAQNDRGAQAMEESVVRQVARCWDSGEISDDLDALPVEIRAELNRNATVKRAEVVDRVRYQQDPLYRLAADRALSALLDPRCQPLRLPQHAYAQWSELVFTFHPVANY